jgi:hypothetical protein
MRIVPTASLLQTRPIPRKHARTPTSAGEEMIRLGMATGYGMDVLWNRNPLILYRGE